MKLTVMIVEPNSSRIFNALTVVEKSKSPSKDESLYGFVNVTENIHLK